MTVTPDQETSPLRLNETPEEITHDEAQIKANMNLILDLLLKDVTLTKTIGKITKLWYFIRDQIRNAHFRLNDQLEIVLDNENVWIGTNVIDLIRFTVMHRGAVPTGYRDFLKLLKMLHVPKRLLYKPDAKKKNDKRKKAKSSLYLKRQAQHGVPGANTTAKLRKLESF